MAQITGGSVTFGRTVQPAQYESKKSEITLTFAVAEDDGDVIAQNMLNLVSKIAQEKALELVGLKVASAPTAKVEALPEGKVEQPNPAFNKIVDEDRPGSKRGPKPKKPAEAEKPTEDPLAAAEAAAEANNEATEAAAHKAAMAKANAEIADADSDLLGAAEFTSPQPVSDKELMDAVTKKMAEINSGPKIKEVREKFVTSPKGIRDIPQDKRAEFLVELAKLTK